MDVLLVTGAGASRELGVGRPLPLMADWAEALRDALNDYETGLAAAIGLNAGFSGPEFEETLGALLRWRDLRSLNQRFAGLGGVHPGEVFSEVIRSRATEDDRLDEIIGALNRTLFAEFGAARIDEENATIAYGNLLAAVPSLDSLAVVTTNYDPAIEIALWNLRYRAETGFERRPGRAPVLEPEQMVARCREDKDAVPVLHLHGAVGWYEHDGLVLEHPQDQEFNPTLGRPVVLYPDPDKDPTRDAVVQALWAEFDDALHNATNVVVLGHSLHDAALVSRLRSAAKRARIAICTYGRPGEPAAGEPAVVGADEEAQRILNLVPGCSVIPVVFGMNASLFKPPIEQWFLN